ncbi:MAG TPA: ABC transporter substrate binding protein, partial [Rhodocyclaceae bacterium]|nr:ABC transporter substrate binding protein [Rhodocyclaceae bacterium]
ATGGGRLGRIPIVAALLPRAAFESARKRTSNPTTAVILDQPLIRQMALLRYAFPNQRRVGVILGPDSQQYQTGLERAAQDQGLQLNVYKAEGDATLYPVLQRLLDESDLLLAVPDAAIYNGGSIQNVLLAAYRQKVPLMAYSPAYVRAGALLALYSTPAQVGVQTAKVVKGVLAGGSLPNVQSPMDFVVSVNANVARSLGFRLSDDALRIQLLNREGL